MLIANDTAELWIGESDSWQSKKLVAKVDQSGAQAKWTRRSEGVEKPLFPEQVVKLSLQAGKRYYVEILHKQQGKEDFCALGWIKPGAQTPEIVGPDALTSWGPDPADLLDSGLPNAWMESVGLMAEGVEPANRHAWADADHDGRTNWDEFKAATDPLKPETVETKNFLSCDVWTAVAGERIEDLALSPLYPAKPTQSTLVDNMDFYDEGASYGVRLRGYLTAPDDGSYLFHISGNNACILYLAKSEDKFTKRLIARTIRGTGWRFFGRNPAQRSEPVELKKGDRYYIEVLYKRGAQPGQTVAQGDHASVAWTRAERKGLGEKVIGAEYFSPYKKDPRDADDDDLLDSWEQTHGLDATDPSGANGAWGDPDHDLLENLLEYQSDLDPQVADVHGAPGFALWEYWGGIAGNLPALRANPAFPLKPTRREWVTALEGPSDFADFYGSRLRAFLIPPLSGDYTFAIAGDDQCELWLSNSELKYHRERIASVTRWTGYREWRKEAGQVSKPVRLEAGKRYFIEAIHKQDTRGNHVSVSWQIAGRKEFEIIRGDALAGFAGDPDDANDDDMLDSWQVANGIPLDIRSGNLDPDRDGLTNLEEYRLGTRANMIDSDGDGINDGDEFRIYHTDPLRSDAVPPVLHATVPLQDYRTAAGDWMLTGSGTLRSIARHGEVNFSFDIDSPGIYVVKLDAASVAPDGQSWQVPVIARVNGTEIGHGDIAPQGSSFTWLAPWLPAGRHVVTIDNRNVHLNVGLEISSVTLLRHEGPDLDGNAIPDWMEKLFRNTNRFAAECDTPIESEVSPACIEGISRLPGDVVIEADGIATPVGVGIGGAWYADVPLAAEGDTTVEARFEKGAVRQAMKVRWSAVNVFGAPETMRVRVGDSIKFKALPPDLADSEGASCDVNVDGKNIFHGKVSEETVVRFTEPGQHIVEAAVPGAQDTVSARITVEVFAADFGMSFNLAAGNPRIWNLTGVSPLLFVDTDKGLRLDEVPDIAAPGRRFKALWATLEPASPRVLARLWKDGPIVAATSVNVFRMVDAAFSGDAQVVRTLADGTRVVEIGYVIYGVIPSDFSLWIEFIVTDAVFANGETRWHLTAADFDQNGEARVLIYKAPGDGVAYVCHWNKTYADDPTDGNKPDAGQNNATTADPTEPSSTAPVEAPTAPEQ
jgi:hypothetical protein